MEGNTVLPNPFHLSSDETSSQKAFVFEDSDFENQIRRQHSWWLPVSLPQRCNSLQEQGVDFRNTSTGRLPSDVALWLVELRHTSDSDELLSNLKLNVDCDSLDGDVWCHESCDSETSENSSNRTRIETEDPLAETERENEVGLPEYCCTHEADVFVQPSRRGSKVLNSASVIATSEIDKWTTITTEDPQTVRNCDRTYHSAYESCDTTDNSENLEVVADPCLQGSLEKQLQFCKNAEVQFQWNVNPAYYVAGISLNVGGGKWQCRGDCGGGSETTFRKLCQSALKELGALLDSCNAESGSGHLDSTSELAGDESAQCGFDALPCSEDDAFEHTSTSSRDSNPPHISAGTSCYEHCSERSRTNFVQIHERSPFPDVPRGNLNSSENPAGAPADISAPSDYHRPPRRSHSTSIDGHCDLSSGVEIKEDRVELMQSDSVVRNELDNASDTMSCLNLNRKCDDVLHGLERMMLSLQGMENNCIDTKHELIENQDIEFLLMCENANSLVEETFQSFHCTWQPPEKPKTQSVASSSFSDDVFLSAPLIVPEENVFEAGAPVLKIARCTHWDINSIFDDGVTTPIPPIRKKKLKNKFPTDTLPFPTSSETCDKQQLNTDILVDKPSENIHCKEESIAAASGELEVVLDSQSQELLTRTTAFSKERRQTRTVSYYEDAYSCCQKYVASMSSSEEKCSDSDICSLSADLHVHVAHSQANASHVSDSLNHTMKSCEFEPTEHSSLLEVTIPQIKPISSFEFPLCSTTESVCTRDSTLSFSSFGRAGKQQMRPITSVEDFGSHNYEDFHTVYSSLERSRKGSGSSDIAAWKQDLQRSGFFSQEDDYMQSDEWFSSTDHEGRVYFFEENSSESSWTLPKISVDDSEISGNKSLQEVSDPLLRSQDGEKRSTHRITKARSMLVADQKQRDTTNKSSSIPRSFLHGKTGALMEGILNRTKITENSKKVRKHWSSSYVVLSELHLLFFKDLKSSSTLVHRHNNKSLQPAPVWTCREPDITVELSGARLEAGDKMSKRKNVFLVSAAGLQVLCQCDDSQQARTWCNKIKDAISNLNRSASKLFHPQAQEEVKKSSPIGRSKSLKLRSQDGYTEDQISSNEEQQTKIRDRLKKFFNRRPTRETLASKGIYKDEPVFDNHLEKVCPPESPRIPKFVKLCITTIEGKEENMKTDGLYRASGNLSHVQKIRLEVDQNNLSVLEKEEDVHVLTGALKLFFRELKEPLIPYELFATAMGVGETHWKKNEKIQMFREIVQCLPIPNRHTLEFLLKHLRKVTEYDEFNRMHIPNLAIVFGPTLIWREKEFHQNIALEYMQQNLVIEFFLQEFDEIFK